MQPRELPAKGSAPVTLSSTTRIRVKDGSTPPTLDAIDFLIDKHGSVNSKALPRLPAVEAGRGNALAGPQALCRRPGRQGDRQGAGDDAGAGAVPDDLARLLLQRGADRRQADPDRPRLRDRAGAAGAAGADRDRAGLRRAATDSTCRSRCPKSPAATAPPTLAEASVGTTRKQGGKKVGYINAQCSGGRLQVEGKLTFTNGDSFPDHPYLAMSHPRLRRAALLSLLAATALAGTAAAALVEVDDIVLRADGGFKPQTLPRRQFRPDRLQRWPRRRRPKGAANPRRCARR